MRQRETAALTEAHATQRHLELGKAVPDRLVCTSTPDSNSKRTACAVRVLCMRFFGTEKEYAKYALFARASFKPKLQPGEVLRETTSCIVALTHSMNFHTQHVRKVKSEPCICGCAAAWWRP
jgi:hypothetical protein